MGIRGGMQFYHSIKNLKLCDLITICREQSGDSSPSIFIDCNWLANYLGRRGDYVKKNSRSFSCTVQNWFFGASHC